jgi:hypothetical protein
VPQGPHSLTAHIAQYFNVRLTVQGHLFFETGLRLARYDSSSR